MFYTFELTVFGLLGIIFYLFKASSPNGSIGLCVVLVDRLFFFFFLVTCFDTRPILPCEFIVGSIVTNSLIQLFNLSTCWFLVGFFNLPGKLNLQSV